MKNKTLLFALSFMIINAFTNYCKSGPIPDVLMQTGTLVVDSANFYDSGGLSGDYNDDEDYTLTLKPSSPGKLVKVVFNSFDLETCCDHLMIYDGMNTSANLIGDYYDFACPMTFTALNDSGALTFRFHSDGSATYSGWEAVVSTAAFVPVATISITGGSSISTNGDSLQLSATITPADATIQDVNWIIASGADKALVTKTGLVVAQNDGIATVRAYAKDGSGVYGEHTITISGQSATPKYYMRNGTFKVTSGKFYDSGGPIFDYANNEIDTITFFPGTPTKAVQITFNSISIDGSLRVYDGPKAEGYNYTYIYSPGIYTATQRGGALTFVFSSYDSNTGWDADISLFQPVLVDSISISGSNSITYDNDYSYYNATVYPSNAAISTVSWSVVSGNKLARIDQNGMLVAQYNGDVVIRATALDSTGVYKDKTVHLSGQDSSKIFMSNDTVNISKNIFYDTGGPYFNYLSNEHYVLTMMPDTAGMYVQALFNSYDIHGAYDSLIVFNGTDTLAPLLCSLNSTRIPTTITADNGSGALTFRFVSGNDYLYSGWEAVLCLVRKKLTESIAITGTSDISYDLGTTYLTATVSPYDAYNKEVAWTVIDGNDKAVVRQTGNDIEITALRNGTMHIRAAALDTSHVFEDVEVTISGQTTNKIIMCNDTISISEGWFFDSGGPYIDYMNNENYTLTFLPSVAGKMVRLNFTALNLYYDDTLAIYSGSSTSAHLLFKGTNSIPYYDVVGENPNGALTVKFVSNNNYPYSGWTAKINLVRPVFVQSIDLTGPDEITSGGSSIIISDSVRPYDAYHKNVTWSVSDPSMAYFYARNDTSIRLYGRRNGTVTLRASATDGSGVYKEKVITISGQTFVPISSITVTEDLNRDTITTDNGRLYMGYDYLPIDADYTSIKWSVSNTNIASINEYGTLQAIKNGIIIVRATALDGSGVYGEMAITISNQVTTLVSSIDVYASETTISVDNGQLDINYDINPYEADNHNVSWSLSNDTVASISKDGTLTAIKDGVVIVRATATDGSGVYDEILIIVTNQDFIPIADIIVDGAGSVASMLTNSSLQMIALVMPSYAEYKKLAWSVNNSLASISFDGMLHSNTSIGSVVVRATALDGSDIYGEASITIQSTTNIAVNSSPNGLSIFPNPTSGELFISNAIDLNSFEIYSMDGKMLMSIRNTKQTAKINLKSLTSGVYILRAYSENKVFITKIIKR